MHLTNDLSDAMATFSELAARDPAQLAACVRDRTLPQSQLAVAAACLGRASDHALVREALLPLLSHSDVQVRLGALDGLGLHLDERVRASLRWLLLEEPDALVCHRAKVLLNAASLAA